MSDAVTIGALKRITFDPHNDNVGPCIGGQNYWDVYFTGGEIQNTTLLNCTLVPSGGGGGVTSQIFITSGNSGTCPLNGLLGFKSPTSGAKTAHIPAPTGSLNIVIIADMQGTADAGTGYPITIIPTSGSIIGAQNQVYTNYGSMTLLDTLQGWLSI